MAIAGFLESLFDNGRVKVSAPDRIEQADLQSARDVLVCNEAIWRESLPTGVPDFAIDSALWAAELVFRAAQFQVFRDVNAEFIQQAFQQPHPNDESASAHYSVDLCFRYLPDILRMSKPGSADDPLNQQIENLLCRWPLSAIGVRSIDPPQRNSAFQHGGLWQMFVDRTIETSDERLMNDSRVKQSIKIAIGSFPDLVPALSNLTDEQETAE